VAARFGVKVIEGDRWIMQAKIGQSTPRPQGQPRGSRLDGYTDVVIGIT